MKCKGIFLFFSGHLFCGINLSSSAGIIIGKKIRGVRLSIKVKSQHYFQGTVLKLEINIPCFPFRSLRPVGLACLIRDLCSFMYIKISNKYRT